MLPRVLETEAMDTLDEAVDYDAMDHSEVNRRFVDELLAQCSPNRSAPWRVIDVGAGTALITIELVQRMSDFCSA